MMMAMMMMMMMMMMMNRHMFGYFPPLFGSGSPSSRRTSTTTFSSPRKISISRTSPTVFRFKSRNRSALCFMGIRIDPDLTPVMMSPRISRPYSSRSVPLEKFRARVSISVQTQPGQGQKKKGERTNEEENRANRT